MKSAQILQLTLVFSVVVAVSAQSNWGQGQGYYGGTQRPGFSYYGLPPSHSRYPQPPYLQQQLGHPGGQQNFAWVGVPQYYYPVYVPPPSSPFGGQGQRQFGGQGQRNFGGQGQRNFGGQGQQGYFSGPTQGRNFGGGPNWNKNNNFGRKQKGNNIFDLDTASSEFYPSTTGLQSGNAVSSPPGSCPVGEFRHPVTGACVIRKIRGGR